MENKFKSETNYKFVKLSAISKGAISIAIGVLLLVGIDSLLFRMGIPFLNSIFIISVSSTIVFPTIFFALDKIYFKVKK